ncbi:hypothetical protein EJD24_25940, partial [Salmonella enterica subsp. enterica serovar Chailey]|nr:hypothetical protein [Salmonella enterica subsp. enterica serovar Chailey]
NVVVNYDFTYLTTFIHNKSITPVKLYSTAIKKYLVLKWYFENEISTENNPVFNSANDIA